MSLPLFLAQNQQPAPGGGMSFFIMMGLLFVVFYFFIIRPQRKREDQRKAMIDAVQKGDRIITVGGVHGTVLKVEETSILAEVDQNVKLRFEKNAVASVGKKEGA